MYVRKQRGSRSGLLYYHQDALGNIIDVTDRIGEQITKYRYDAFGNLFTHMAAPYNAVGFTGKSYDAKAGLMDFSARWYSPNEGRFITTDTFGGWSDIPASMNRFSYAHNNPATFTDPTGHCIPVDPEGSECIPAPPGGGDDGGGSGSGGSSGGSGGGSSGGGSGGSGSGGSGGYEPPAPPPPPTFEEILAMRTGNYNRLAGYMPSYTGGSSNHSSYQDQYIFGNSGSSFGFDVKSSFGSLSKFAPRRMKMPSTGFMRQAGSVGLDMIPVVGNVKSGIEAIMGKDLVTGEKLSGLERGIAFVGIFTGGAGKTALKGVNAGLGFAQSGKRVTKGTTKPLQKHHYATNKSKKYTPQMENITKKYGLDLDLDDEWNKELLPHQGRHPYAYHDYVLDKLSTYDRLAKGDREKFLKLFEGLKQEVRDNPDMLYKEYWRSK